MLPYMHHRRQEEAAFLETHAEFLQEAPKIVTGDRAAIAARVAAIDEEKVRLKEKYLAPQFAAVETAGNVFLDGDTYDCDQKSVLLGSLLFSAAKPGTLKSIAEATDEDLAALVQPFGTGKHAEAAAEYRMNTHKTVPHIMGAAHESCQCHNEFIYRAYHDFLDGEHIKPSFVPANMANSRHYLIVGGGPVGLTMAIEALLRGHRVTVVDCRTHDNRDRYVGVWPKDIDRFTKFGMPKSAWVVWTILNATNDRAPKQRRNTSRLFLNISLAVRILTWSAVKLGATVLRGAFFDYDSGSLVSPTHQSTICPIAYDEIVFSTGSVGDVPKSLIEHLEVERTRPFSIAQQLLTQAPIPKWEDYFDGEQIHCTRYLLDKVKAMNAFQTIRDVNEGRSERLSHVPSLFIQLPPECVFGNGESGGLDLDQNVFLPPGWHITGLTRVLDQKLFKILIFGPLVGRIGSSIASASDAVALGQSLLASTRTTGSSQREYNLQELLKARAKGLVYVITTDFRHLLRKQNIINLGENCFDRHNVDLSTWRPASTQKIDGKRVFIVGDCLNTPWFKLALGLYDGISHVDCYWKGRDDEENGSGESVEAALSRHEYQLSRRQLHICISLVTIKSELLKERFLQRLVADTRRGGGRVRGWSETETESDDDQAIRGRSRNMFVQDVSEENDAEAGTSMSQ